MTEIDGVMLCEIFWANFNIGMKYVVSKKKTNKKSNTRKRKWIRMGMVEIGYRLTGNI